MAEIKSTLDLVMEKTKHLQFSEQERRQQQSKEAGARIRGVLQKLVDQDLRIEQFTKDYQRLKSDYHLKDDAALISECLGQIVMIGDNQAVLAALDAAEGFELSAIETVIEEFQQRYRDLAAAAEQRLVSEYALRDQMSGSALVPNLNLDIEWRGEKEALEKEFRARMSEAL